MKYLALFASTVFAVSLGVSGAMAGGGGSQETGSSQGVQSQGSTGVDSRSDQGMSGQQGVGGGSGMSQGGAAQGIESAQVRQIQEQLSSMGFTPGNTNGELDAETMEAIRNFQQAQGIQPTGQIDTQTLQALGVSQEGEPQQYYGVSPEFDQSQEPIQQQPGQGQQPGQQMDQQQLDRGQMNQYDTQPAQPQGTMGR